MAEAIASDIPQLVDEDVVAEKLGVSVKKLQTDRAEGVGIPFHKLGTTARAPVRYDVADVLAYLAASRRSSTSSNG